MRTKSLEQITREIIEFRDARGWEINDRPENLAKSIIIEAAELLENFQWGTSSIDIENVKDEIADVMIYSLALANDMGFNVEEIISNKLNKNAIKYPIKK